MIAANAVDALLWLPVVAITALLIMLCVAWFDKWR